MKYVTINDPPSMNLLGLLMASIIERNLAHEDKKRRFDRLDADIVVQAGEMTVCLRFDRGKLLVTRDLVERPGARVQGSLDALMKLSLGGGMVGPWLTGRLRTRGNPFLLLKLRPLIQVA